MRLSCGKINTSFEHSEPEDFVRSQWQTKEKCVAYLIYRWCIAVFFIFSVAVSIATSTARGELSVYFIYLTHWNLVLTMISMIWSACLVTMHHTNRLQLSDRMNGILKASWLLSTLTNMYAFLVSIVYWGVLYRTELSVVDLNNIIVHATNSLAIVINLAVVKQPERLGLYIYPLCCGLVYLFFSWLYPWLGGKNRRGQDFIYPILNWKQKPEIAFLVAVFVMVFGALTHCFIVGSARVRTTIHQKYFAQREEEKPDIFILTC